jgi:hypothetical protein
MNVVAFGFGHPRHYLIAGGLCRSCNREATRKFTLIDSSKLTALGNTKIAPHLQHIGESLVHLVKNSGKWQSSTHGELSVPII